MTRAPPSFLFELNSRERPAILQFCALELPNDQVAIVIAAAAVYKVEL